jgi:hypothetical protein
MLRAHLNATGAGDVGGDGLAEIGLALGRAIVGPALVKRIFGGVYDVLRRREVGFADFEVDHVLALRFQGAGANQDFEGKFDAYAGHSLSELHVCSET